MSQLRVKVKSNKKRGRTLAGIVLTGCLMLNVFSDLIGSSVGIAFAKSGDWITISSREELEAMLIKEDSGSYNLDGRYRLEADLDLSDLPHSIGTDYRPFTGELDGNGHILSGLTRPLFGTTQDAEITNLLLGEVNLSDGATYFDGEHYVMSVSALAGRSIDTQIKNCAAVGEIHVRDPKAVAYEVEPAPLPTPESTALPIVTATPETTVTPEISAVPEVTDTPTPVTTPEITMTPESSFVPEETQTPETEQPQGSAVPEETANSEEAQDPEEPEMIPEGTPTENPSETSEPRNQETPEGAPIKVTAGSLGANIHLDILSLETAPESTEAPEATILPQDNDETAQPAEEEGRNTPEPQISMTPEVSDDSAAQPQDQPTIVPENTEDPELTQKVAPLQRSYDYVTAEQVISGGLVGSLEGKSLISDCYTLVTTIQETSMKTQTAGMSGRVAQHSRIENSYSTGLIGGEEASGFVSENYGTLQNCFTTVTLDETAEKTAAFVYYNEGAIKDCSFDQQMALAEDTAAEALNTSEMVGTESKKPVGNWVRTEGAYPQICYFAQQEHKTIKENSAASAVAIVLADGTTLKDALQPGNNSPIELPQAIGKEEVQWSAEGDLKINEAGQAYFETETQTPVEVLPEEKTPQSMRSHFRAVQTETKEQSTDQENGEEDPAAKEEENQQVSGSLSAQIGSITRSRSLQATVQPRTPMIGWNEFASANVDNSAYAFSGSGTSADPYILENAEQVAIYFYKTAIGSISATNYAKIRGTIDMLGSNYSSSGYLVWAMPDYSRDRPYQGHLSVDREGDGLTNVILWTGTNNYDNGFLFGISNATIDGLTLDLNIRPSETGGNSNADSFGGLVGRDLGGSVISNVTVNIMDGNNPLMYAKFDNEGTSTGSGGLVGLLSGKGSVYQNCTVNAENDQVMFKTKVDQTQKASTAGMGGILGTIDSNGGVQILNCHSSLSLQGSNVGGIVGLIQETTGEVVIDKCSNSGKILNNNLLRVANLGGLIGQSSGSNVKIFRSRNLGTVELDSSTNLGFPRVVGGLIGAEEVPVTLAYSAHAGVLSLSAQTSDDYVGGLVGFMKGEHDQNTPYFQCYVAGTMSNTGGGYVLYGASDPSLKNGTSEIYYDQSLTNILANGKYTTAAAAGYFKLASSVQTFNERVAGPTKFQAALSGIYDDPATVWSLDPESGYMFILPELPAPKNWKEVGQQQSEATLKTTPAKSGADAGVTMALSGTGSQADPYILASEEALAWFTAQIDSSKTYYVQLAADMDLAGLNYTGESTVSSDYTNCLPWISMEKFSGEFDGKYHKIKNLFSKTGGFFGDLINTTSITLQLKIQKVELESGSVNAGGDHGSLISTIDVSDAAQVIVDQCGSKVSVSSDVSGGLVGRMVGGTLQHCYYRDAVVDGVDYIAGLVGTADSGIVKNSYAANVTFTSTRSIDYVSSIINSQSCENCFYIDITDNTNSLNVMDGSKEITLNQAKTWGFAYQLNGGNEAGMTQGGWINARDKYNELDLPVLGKPEPVKEWAYVGEWIVNFHPEMIPATGVNGAPTLLKTSEDMAWLSWIEATVKRVNTDDYILTQNGTYDFTGSAYGGTVDKPILWTPIGMSYSSYYGGDFNGNNSVLKNLRTEDGTWEERINSYGGLFGYYAPKEASKSIHDLHIRDSYFEGGWASGAIAANIESGVIQRCSVENTTVVVIDSNGSYGGGIAGLCYAGAEPVKTKLLDCYVSNTSVSAKNAGSLAGLKYGNEILITNAYAADVTLKDSEKSGIFVSNENDGLNASENTYYYNVTSNSAFQSDSGAVSKTSAELKEYSVVELLNAGRTGIWGWTKDQYPHLGASTFTSWKDVIQNNVIQKQDLIDKGEMVITDLEDVEFCYTETSCMLIQNRKQYTVSSPEALAYFLLKEWQEAGNRNLWKLVLDADLDMTGANYGGTVDSPLPWTAPNVYNLLIDGQNHTISHLADNLFLSFDGEGKMSHESWENTLYSEIRNLTLKDTGGGISANTVYVKAENCHLENSHFLKEEYHPANGMFGEIFYSIIDNCSVKNMEIDRSSLGNYSSVGGICSWMTGTTVRNCTAENIQFLDSALDVTSYGALLVGIAVKDTLYSPAIQNRIENCTAAGENNSFEVVYAAGIVGQMEFGVIDQCQMKAKFNKMANNVSGIAGSIIETTITNCTVAAEAGLNVGQGRFAGLISVVDGTASTLERCAVLSNVGSSTADSAGGITFGSASGLSIKDCYVLGDVTAKKNAYGIAPSAASIENCYFGGKASAVNAYGVTSGTAVNSYYDGGKTAAKGGGTSKTASEMQTKTFAATLNAGRTGSEAVWAWRAGVNNNYPYLGTSYESWNDVGAEIAAGTLTGDGFIPSGNGSSASPYQIGTPEALAWFAYQVNNVDGKTGIQGQLTQDIDLMGTVYGGTADTFLRWVPIGNIVTKPYAGHFNGQGYQIKNMRVVETKEKATGGLFGLIDLSSGNAIEQIHIYNASVDASTAKKGNAGGLVGSIKNGVVRKCSVESSDIKGIYTGGLVGSSYTDTSGDKLSWSQQYDSCYVINTKVTGEMAVGLSGFLWERPTVKISNCYAVGGTVTGSKWASPFAFSNYYDSTIIAVNSYYADMTVVSDNVLSSSDGTEITTDQMKTWGFAFQLNGNQDDFSKNTVWRPAANAAENQGYPVFGTLSAASNWSQVGEWFENFQTKPTLSNNSYQISKPEELAWIAYKVNNDNANYAGKGITLSENIDLFGSRFTGRASDSSALEWIPFSKLTGTFSGNQKEISGINVPGRYAYQGFIQVLDHGVVEDLTVRGTVSGLPNTTTRYAGIAAIAQNKSVIRQCVNYINVGASRMAGSNYTGGIVAQLSDSTVENCINFANITDSNWTNGFHNGGIVGGADTGSIIRNCYNAGSASSGSSTYSGGTGHVVSPRELNATVTNCFYNTDTAGAYSTAVNNVTGKTTVQMKSWGFAYQLNGAQATLSDNKVWRPAENNSENQGYPTFCSSGSTLRAASNWSEVGGWVANFAEDSSLKPTLSGSTWTVNSPEALAYTLYTMNTGVSIYNNYNITLDADLNMQGSRYSGKSDTNLIWNGYATSEAYPYLGTFEGKNHVLSNLSGGSFFLCYLSGTMKDFSLDSSCSFTTGGRVSFIAQGIGGFTLFGIQSAAVMTGSDGAGLMNYSSGSEPAFIEQCGVTGNITGKGNNNSAVSGIINYGTSNVTVKDCYYIGTLTDTSTVESNKLNMRGIGGNNVNIVNCYFAGTIVGGKASNSIGASGTSVTNSYYNLDLQKNFDIIKGKGLTTAQMKSMGFAYQLNGAGDASGSSSWVWRAAADDSENQGYPVFGQAEPFKNWMQVGEWIDDFGTKPTESGGSYSIANANQLAWFMYKVNSEAATYAGKSVKLTGDIDLAGFQYTGKTAVGTDYTGALSWKAINGYTGHFDGNYHNIKNLSGSSVFGEINSAGALVEKLGVESGMVQAAGNAGGLVSTFKSGKLSQCYNKATVKTTSTGAYTYAGGIAALAYTGSVFENCYNLGTVISSSTQTDSNAGGIVGYCAGGAEIKNCYNAGTISGGLRNGPIYAYHSNYASNYKLTNCYYQTGKGGTTTAQGKGVSESFLKSWGAAYQLNGGTGIPTEYTIWRTAASASENSGYPVFGSTTNKLRAPTDWNEVGEWIEGFGSRPAMDLNGAYTLASPEQLAWMSYVISNSVIAKTANFTITKTIDLSGSQYTNKTTGVITDALPWVPVASYAGTFSGNNAKGYEVTNMYAVADGNSGFFKDTATTAVVQGLTVSGEVHGNTRVGGLVGDNNGKLDSCVNKAAVRRKGTEVTIIGGLAGVSSKGVITECINRGTIGLIDNSGYDSGGLIGLLFDGTLERCLNYGDVYGVTNASGDIVAAGGLIGYLGGGTVKDCASIGGSINGSYAGGLVGRDVSGGMLTHCYASGSINGSSRSAGLLGTGSIASGSFTHSYYDSTLAPHSSGISAITNAGKTTIQMKSRSVTDLLNDDRKGDNRVWFTSLDSEETQGYPTFVAPKVKQGTMNLVRDGLVVAGEVNGFVMDGSIHGGKFQYIVQAADNTFSTAVETPEMELQAGSIVLDADTKFSLGTENANKKMLIKLGSEGAMGNAIAFDTPRNTTLVNRSGDVSAAIRIDVPRAYSKTTPLYFIVNFTDSQNQQRYEYQITVNPAASRTLDVTLPVAASMELNPGVKDTAESQELFVQNNSGFPINVSISSITPQADKDVKLTPVAQSVNVVKDNAQDQNVHLWLTNSGIANSGLSSTIKLYYDPAKTRIPLSLRLGANSKAETADAASTGAQLKFKYGMDYGVVNLLGSDKTFGYDVLWDFSMSAEDQPYGTTANISK
ncbi:ZmpA/ZmpB/ZmpC family metallo-endopeptidase-related protein [Holdemania massiliensis]|uniref:ZmpA/ZmpB/ZmpC family metallo-endopeptidase-related protein n=1 Tax=Holdemania massiliensis TaxID=1468449 RepID=UPI001F05BC40|nr:ZmpA/ZmpB/ZmpC family metallo-endopeptidase-related protein [Holdemania massiliensis]MCH1942161.1 hypothetical protein [Holdemania massiliensis]